MLVTESLKFFLENNFEAETKEKTENNRRLARSVLEKFDNATADFSLEDLRIMSVSLLLLRIAIYDVSSSKESAEHPTSYDLSFVDDSNVMIDKLDRLNGRLELMFSLAGIDIDSL